MYNIYRMSNNLKYEIPIKEEEEDEDDVSVAEIYIEIKEEIKEEPVYTCKNGRTLDEHIDTAIETGSLGLAGKCILFWVMGLCSGLWGINLPKINSAMLI